MDEITASGWAATAVVGTVDGPRYQRWERDGYYLDLPESMPLEMVLGVLIEANEVGNPKMRLCSDA